MDLTFWMTRPINLATCLSVLGLVWYVSMVGVGLLGCWKARTRYRRRPPSSLATAAVSNVPGVSILRPLKGLDANLYENLESTFDQDYPNYEILLSVADKDDQALGTVRALMFKYPHVKAKVMIGEQNVGVNPKVNNLMDSYHEAAHDILWVLDSNIMVDRGTLARSVDAFINASHGKSTVGLVHHVPFASTTESSFGSRVEEAFLNTNHAKMYIAINAVAIESCVVGKSNFYRKSDLDRVNGSLRFIHPNSPPPPTNEIRGLKAFGRYLAEDNMIAAALWHELGRRHELSCDVAHNIVGHMTLADYVWRRVRWIRVRKHMVLAATLAEPFSESVLLSAMLGSSTRYLFALPFWISLPLHFTYWFLVDLDVYASLAGHPLPRSKMLSFFVAWAARELLALPVWSLAIFGSEVQWRGKEYRVLRGGEVRQIRT